MAVNDGEDVVEIVRDAAGELADGLHLLRLAQLLLQPPVQGHVAEEAQQQQGFAAQLHKRVGNFKHRLAPVAQPEDPLDFVFDFVLAKLGLVLFSIMAASSVPP